MELHALAQFEHPFVGFGVFPAFRQQRRQLQVAVVAGQRFVDVALEAQRERFVQGHRVHRCGVALVRPVQGLGGRAGAERQRGGYGSGKRCLLEVGKSTHSPHAPCGARIARQK
ncbi:hypothetical protein D3C72_1900420 [compost metagenome]